ACAEETSDATAVATAIISLRQNIANPPRRIYAPCLLRVIVEQRIRSHLIDEGLAIGVDILLLVGRTTDDLCRLSIPFPVYLKPGLRFRKHRIVELGSLPGGAGVGADLDLRDLSVAAPRKARDAIISRPDLHHSGG